MAGKVNSSGIRHITLPESYIRPVNDRSQVSDCNDVPVIDIGGGDRRLIIQQIGDACRRYGFFQVINHGVPDEIVENVQKEKVHKSRDYLRLQGYPLDQYTPETPPNPSSFKEDMGKHCSTTGMVINLLFSGLEVLEDGKWKPVQRPVDLVANVRLDEVAVRPEVSRIAAHTDPNALTILLQDHRFSGLEVLEDGKWKPVQHPVDLVANVRLDEVPVRPEVSRIAANGGWYLDSGATRHVCDSRDKFVDYTAVSGQHVIVANNAQADVVGIGTVMVRFISGYVLTLRNVLHVPTISKCLVSVSKLGEHGFRCYFGAREVVIMQWNNFVGGGFMERGLYRLNITDQRPGA